MNNVGLSISEGVANGASPYGNPSKRNIGLLGQFTRGGAFKPTKVTSLDEFNVIFGGANSAFYGPAIVKSIFDEASPAPVTLYISRVVGSGSRSATANVSIMDSATMDVTAAYKGSEDPGTWANGNVSVILYPKGAMANGMFTLYVTYKDKTETYVYSTLKEIESAVNRVSKYVRVTFSKDVKEFSYTTLTGTLTATTTTKDVTGTGTSFSSEAPVGTLLFTSDGKLIGRVASVTSDTALTLAANAGNAVTAATAKKRDTTPYTGSLSGGTDGEVSESDFYPVPSTTEPKGLASFDGCDVQIIACTEYHSLSMAKVLNSYLNEAKNPIGVINLPYGADEGTAELYSMELSTDNISYLAGYMGWCKVLDSSGNELTIPNIGPILGSAYIRTPYQQGDFIHIPPGGEDSAFQKVESVEPENLSQGTINRLVKQFSCNVVRYAKGLGYYVGSSRTYSTNDLYTSIHIRLQTSYYLRVFQNELRFMEQKPNTPEFKNEALVKMRTYFKNEYDNGALERSVDFDTAYQGICDKSNNPSTQNRKLTNIDLYWIPTECTESIHVTLQRNDGILTLTENS